MEKYSYNQFLDQLMSSLNSNGNIEFYCDYYNYFNWNGVLEIKMGQFSNEEIGPLFPILHKWLGSEFYYFFREIEGIHNTVYGKIILIQNDPFVSVGFEGPFDEEFSDFCCRFNFDDRFFLETLEMKNDNFVRGLSNFEIKRIFIDGEIEKYRVGDSSHYFDFELYYEDVNKEKNIWQLNDHQKQLVRDYILNHVLKDVLPTLNVYSDCVETYNSIYIEGDIDANHVSLGSFTTSEHLISLEHIRESLIRKKLNSFQ